MSSSPGASREGKKKALLIAVERVEGTSVSLPQPYSDTQLFRELLISKYDYAEEDIIVLSRHRSLHESFWPSRENVFNKIKWLVDDVGEHDRLVFYYSGHREQTFRRHDSMEDGKYKGDDMEDGKDEAIYHDGYRHPRYKIIDGPLERLLVTPVLKTKGCQLFAMFDCSHSENILGLKHEIRCSRLLPEVRSSTSGHTSVVDLTMSSSSRDYSPAFLKDLFKRTPPSDHGTAQPAPVRPQISINAAVDSQFVSIMPPYRIVTSPISISPICDHQCVATKEEDDEGHVVCMSGLSFEDMETGATLTKFFLSSLTKNASISYQDLLDDMQSQFTDLQMKAEHMQKKPLGRFSRPRRQAEITSGRRFNQNQDFQIRSNCPLDSKEAFSI